MSNLATFKTKNTRGSAIDCDRSTDERATPWPIFNALNTEFRFTIDVAASRHNARLPRFFTRVENGLAQDWSGERIWCNPPYTNIRPFIEKAWLSSASPVIVLLLPANRTESKWWAELVEPFRDRADSPLTTRFLHRRIDFLGKVSPTGKRSHVPFGSVLLVWNWEAMETATEIATQAQAAAQQLGIPIPLLKA